MNEKQQDKPRMTRRAPDPRIWNVRLFENYHKLLAAHQKGPEAFRKACLEITTQTPQLSKEAPVPTQA